MPTNTYSVKELLKRKLKVQHLEDKVAQHSQFAKWKEIVGAELAKVSKPIKLINRKILVIKVANQIFGQEILLDKQRIITEINSNWENILIEDLRITLGKI